MILEKYKKLGNFNLQMFGDDDNDGGDDGGSGDDDKGSKTVNMSQEDFDAKLNKMYAKGSKKSVDAFKNSDEYKELLALKEANATDAEKTNARLEKLSEVEKEAEKLRSENANLKNRSKVKGLKDSDSIDYVMFEINKLVDDKTDFDEALAKFMESKPQHFIGDDGDEDEKKKFRSSSQKKRNGNNKKSDADAYLDKRYKNSKYRK